MILQVMECLKQNEELRGILDNLRNEQARGLPDYSKNGAHEIPSLGSTEEMTSMKVSYIVGDIFCPFLLSIHVIDLLDQILLVKCSLLKWDASNFSDFSSEKFPGHLIEVCMFSTLFKIGVHAFKILHFFVCLAGPTCEGTEESRGTIGRSHAAFCSTRTTQASIWWSYTIVRFSLSFCIFLVVSKATHSFLPAFDFLHCPFIWKITLQL